MAGTYEEASAALGSAYDLVVFDVNLEGVSSMPLVEARAAKGEPTLVTSGYEEGAAATGVTVLVKPTQPRELSDAVTALGL